MHVRAQAGVPSACVQKAKHARTAKSTWPSFRVPVLATTRIVTSGVRTPIVVAHMALAMIPRRLFSSPVCPLKHRHCPSST